MLIKPYIELEQLMQRKGYNQKELAARSGCVTGITTSRA